MRIPDFSKVRLLVAGDVMLDRYWHGSTARISPEAPVPVVNVGHTQDRPGGAANVALALSALGAGCRLLAPVGTDEASRTLDELVRNSGVEPTWRRHETQRTVTKLRVISQHQQMIRLDFEEPSHRITGLTAAELRPLLAGVAALVLSDYAKGALNDPQPLIAAARQAGVPVLVDPKRADLEAYAGATVLTPNRAELERVVGPCHDEKILLARGGELLERLAIDAMLLTRGEEGMTLLARGAEPVHIPAQAQEVFDVTGAGDTVIAVLSAAVASGESLSQAAALANLAAGVVVGKLGTATVSLEELRLAARPAPRSDERRGVVAEHEVVDLARAAQQSQDVIVMTNGCFDLLHPGHVDYLRRARGLGDRLVVAVNDDASVRRLKGPRRPVNTLADRMAILAALISVDWVVPFAEDTPARLIEAVGPDILVKGGDYRVEQIAGHDSVLARGGRVEILTLVEGHSTTAMLERAKPTINR